jgi:16S rRNA G966 N2-methylase RsmD
VIVTTARKQANALKEKAALCAAKLGARFVERQDRSLEALFAAYGEDVCIVGKERQTLYKYNEAVPFFYHPNASFIRYKQWKKTGTDPLIDAAALSTGDEVLDATLGMGADAVMAALAVGRTGTVTGLEASKSIAHIVATGLKEWQEGDEMFLQALRRVNVVNTGSAAYFQHLKDKSVDVVYFDPMFETKVASPGLEGLRHFACSETLTKSVLDEAKRVARRAVVLKGHWQSEQFARFGFTVNRRQHATFQYGVIEI